MRVLRKAAECRVAHEYIRLLARSKKASSRRENDASCSRQSRFLRGRSDGANRWCRGPESNWLRPPFQGGALPLSYPGNRTNLGILESALRRVKYRRNARSRGLSRVIPRTKPLRVRSPLLAQIWRSPCRLSLQRSPHSSSSCRSSPCHL